MLSLAYALLVAANWYTIELNWIKVKHLNIEINEFKSQFNSNAKTLQSNWFEIFSCQLIWNLILDFVIRFRTCKSNNWDKQKQKQKLNLKLKLWIYLLQILSDILLAKLV